MALRKTTDTHESGFTIIELMVTTFIIGTVVTGMFGLFLLSLRGSQTAERRVAAIALANERMEMVRNLPYLDVGTVGGIPSGSISQSETVTRNSTPYTVATDIRYVDDPFDGQAPADTLNTDYKQVRVEVSWANQFSAEPVRLITHVAPQGIEGGDALGTLIFTALNAQGDPVEEATVQLADPSNAPPVDITTSTNNAGQVVLPGLPLGSQSYQLSASKSGFTSEQTYNQTASFIPNPDYVHLTMLAGEVTEKTFFIDQAAQLEINTLHQASPTPSPTATPSPTIAPSIAYTLQGTKTIGTDGSSNPVYKVDEDVVTDASGVYTHTGLDWDSYIMTIDGPTTGFVIKETSLVMPFVVNPADSLSVDVTLVDHTASTLHVTIVDQNNAPVDNATVQLTGNGHDETLGTGVLGQVLFESLPVNGDYTLDVSAPGFSSLQQPATVAGNSSATVQMVP